MRIVAITALTLFALACTTEPTSVSPDLLTAAHMGNGNGNGGNGGNGGGNPGAPSTSATATFQDLDLYTDTAGAYVNGEPEDCATTVVVTDSARAGIAPGKPPKGKKGRNVDCRSIYVRLDLRHDGLNPDGSHIDTPVPGAIAYPIINMSTHVESALAPVGQGKVNYDECFGNSTGLRFNPDRVAGSTRLNVTGDASSGWRVFSDSETLAGCVATDNPADTTLWHVELDYTVAYLPEN